MFYIWTTPANLKIQLKPSMSEIRNYLVANPIEIYMERFSFKSYFKFKGHILNLNEKINMFTNNKSDIQLCKKIK